MTTLAPGGRITRDVLDAELNRLRRCLANPRFAQESEDAILVIASSAPMERRSSTSSTAHNSPASSASAATSTTLSEAGRRLFAVTRGKRKVTNDADRLQKYLTRFGLTWSACARGGSEASAEARNNTRPG